MARNTVSPEEIIQMNELYYELKNYSAVARELGRSPSTVKRYIITDYIPESKRNIIRFDEKDFPEDIPYGFLAQLDDLSILCVLTAKEKEDLRELQKNEVSV